MPCAGGPGHRGDTLPCRGCLWAIGPAGSQQGLVAARLAARHGAAPQLIGGNFNFPLEDLLQAPPTLQGLLLMWRPVDGDSKLAANAGRPPLCSHVGASGARPIRIDGHPETPLLTAAVNLAGSNHRTRLFCINFTPQLFTCSKVCFSFEKWNVLMPFTWSFFANYPCFIFPGGDEFHYSIPNKELTGCASFASFA